MTPTLTINLHDYSEYVEDITPSRNDVDAEGSGRDVETGEMFRTRIASKLKITVKMARLSETLHSQLVGDIRPAYYTATVLNPDTNTQESVNFYTSTVQYGAQRFSRSENLTYYDGMTFDMTEV